MARAESDLATAGVRYWLGLVRPGPRAQALQEFYERRGFVIAALLPPLLGFDGWCGGSDARGRTYTAGPAAFYAYKQIAD